MQYIDHLIACNLLHTRGSYDADTPTDILIKKTKHRGKKTGSYMNVSEKEKYLRLTTPSFITVQCTMKLRILNQTYYFTLY